jgi:hypothetical protein
MSNNMLTYCLCLCLLYMWHVIEMLYLKYTCLCQCLSSHYWTVYLWCMSFHILHLIRTSLCCVNCRYSIIYMDTNISFSTNMYTFFVLICMILKFCLNICADVQCTTTDIVVMYAFSILNILSLALVPTVLP